MIDFSFFAKLNKKKKQKKTRTRGLNVSKVEAQMFALGLQRRFIEISPPRLIHAFHFF